MMLLLKRLLVVVAIATVAAFGAPAVAGAAESHSDVNDTVHTFLGNTCFAAGGTAWADGSRVVSKKVLPYALTAGLIAADCGYTIGEWLAGPYTAYVCWESHQWWGWQSRGLVSLATSGEYSRC